MIQGTDSGFCDYRYHPMYYAVNKDSPNGWQTEGNAQEHRKNANKMWAYGTDGPCADGSGPTCLSYCGNKIFNYNDNPNNYYVPCVPRDESLPKDRNFPGGRFQEHTPRKKDKWVQDFINFYVSDREEVERYYDREASGHDEYDREDLQVAQRFTEPTERCKDAYNAYFCWVNFPRCNIHTNESLPMCRSACENMFEICGYPEEMWRCGEAEYFNSQIEKNNPVGTPELSTGSMERAMDERKRQVGKKTNSYQDKIIAKGYHPAYKEKLLEDDLFTYTSGSGIDTKSYFPGEGIHSGYIEGGDTYHMDFFPGQPFKSQECDGEDEEGNCNDLPVCTPGFKGAGYKLNGGLALLISSVFSLCALAFGFLF